MNTLTASHLDNGAITPTGTVRSIPRILGAAKIVVMAVVMALALGFTEAAAQRSPGGEGGHMEDSANLEAATDYNPERVRTVLMGIHGFSRGGLDGASTDVSSILMNFIDDPDESDLVRRQAAKALRLYPDEEVLTYIEGRLRTTTQGVKGAMVQSLKGFIDSAPDRVTALMAAMVDDDDITVRYSVLHVAQSMEGSAAVTQILQDRLSRESDPNVRSAIQKGLDRR